MTCEVWSVVVVPFPFSEKPGSKRRPALVLSNASFNEAGHTALAMITSTGHSPWPGDVQVTDLQSAGLQVACIVRLKLFTLDNRLLIRQIGTLSGDDASEVSAALCAALAV